MQLWPAIDLRGGKCVRLQQGDYDRETVFGDDPAQMARKWADEGATCLHLVDLDGAKRGRPVNLEAVTAILKALSAVDVACELGGGIRDQDTLDQLLEMGLSRLVIGTKALKDPQWFAQMCQRFPQRLVLGIDARSGRVATDGWLETSEIQAVELAERFSRNPLAAIIYTDIATDGMMQGPNVAAMCEMKRAVDVPVVASGGVTVAADVAALAAIPMDGVIIGRALYEGTLTLDAALAAVTSAEATNSMEH